MRYLHWLQVVIGLSSIALLTACSSPERCTLVPGTRYEGDGVVVMTSNGGEDGLLFVLFYPVCNLDTLHLLDALRQAPKGFLIWVDHRAVLQAIRHRSVVLRNLDPRNPQKNPRLYLTSVHLAYEHLLESSPGRTKANPYLLDTDQGRIEHPVQVLEVVQPTTFYGL